MTNLNLKTPLIVALLASAAVGAVILATDTDLWDAAPSHAYGLIGFVTVDLILTSLVATGKKFSYAASAAFGLIQFALMLGDITTATQVGFEDSSKFIGYLFGLWTFDLLLMLQLVIAALGFNHLRSSRSKQHSG